MEEETSKKINELQNLEQSFQSIFMQKQSCQIEFNESKNALDELESSKEEDVFRVIGKVMIKSNKDSIKKELSDKKKISETKLKSLEKQELFLKEKIERLRNEVINKLS